MKLNEIIKRELLTGTRLTSDDRLALSNSFSRRIPCWFLDVCEQNNLLGSAFSLGEEADRSGMGVELKWMNADQIIDEVTNIYPGIIASKYGYLPFGICLEGSGDPYFLKLEETCENSLVVRIPHDAVKDGLLCTSRIEIVSLNLIEFFQNSK